MAQALIEMMERGRAGREAMGRAGRARVMEHFRLDSVAAQYGALYRSVTIRQETKTAEVPYREVAERTLIRNVLQKDGSRY